MPIATMTSKGQLTLPAPMRKKLRLRAGSRLELLEQADGAWLLRVEAGDIRAIKRLVPRRDEPVSLDDMDRAIAAGANGAMAADAP
jgi:AbrB family looped-hinge helix DNA binding protein